MDNLNVRTMPLVPNHCILTAVVPLSKDNVTTNFLVTKAVVNKRITVQH